MVSRCHQRSNKGQKSRIVNQQQRITVLVHRTGKEQKPAKKGRRQGKERKGERKRKQVINCTVYFYTGYIVSQADATNSQIPKSKVQIPKFQSSNISKFQVLQYSERCGSNHTIHFYNRNHPQTADFKTIERGMVQYDNGHFLKYGTQHCAINSTVLSTVL